MARPDTTQFVNLLGSASSFSLLLPASPTYDQVASATALKIALDSHFEGTSVIACASPMTVEFNRLVGVNAITTTPPRLQTRFVKHYPSGRCCRLA